jgi:predicted metal-dependent hydrolase
MLLAAYSHPRANREIVLGDARIAYEFRRATRRSIGFVIRPEGLVVSAPKWVPLAEVDAAVRDKARWIIEKLGETQERQQRRVSAQIDWKEGVTLPYLGETMTVLLNPRLAINRAAAALHTDDSATADSSIAGTPRHTLHLPLLSSATPDQIRDATQTWLTRQARRLFTERLTHYAPQLAVQWSRLTLSSAKTRWGSASSDGSIRLNWRLMHFRMPVLDYVVVHELSHLRVMDHSPRFWATVGSVMPDYAGLRRELKTATVPGWA